ncbi:MAG: hypothetical protein HYU36_15950 [Planctomycetes bacterium]|nr:hypothetical protein [Planctomycetota bacterium]
MDEIEDDRVKTIVRVMLGDAEFVLHSNALGLGTTEKDFKAMLKEAREKLRRERHEASDS